MKITAIRIGEISVPLRTPFKTAVRTVYSVEDVIVEVHTDSGIVGYGEAPPTGLVTGDTKGAIIGALRDHIIPAVVGMDLDSIDEVLGKLNSCVLHNTSAKAAVDMALYDAGDRCSAHRCTNCSADTGGKYSPTSPSASTLPTKWSGTPWPPSIADSTY